MFAEGTFRGYDGVRLGVIADVLDTQVEVPPPQIPGYLCIEDLESFKIFGALQVHRIFCGGRDATRSVKLGGKIDLPAWKRRGVGEVEKSPVPALQRLAPELIVGGDRKSTRLNSSHVRISYAVFCLKKKKKGVSKASV